MTAPDSLPLHVLAEENLAAASPDLLRAMVKDATLDLLPLLASPDKARQSRRQLSRHLRQRGPPTHQAVGGLREPPGQNALVHLLQLR
ncbi:hypothetical protein [Streptomyces sp. MK7]|uniref:hypothetical protein n=1 Tax=Streptomyces sp. MK7 TaxID=3067635 RepID=UPI00292F587C|nr:hypothetical protein [Streptomyces sp. MK7]